MQDYDLKYPGINQQAQTVRRNVAQALSNAHNEANPSKELADFLSDAATKAPGYTKPAPDPLPATQVVVSNGDSAVIKTSAGASLAVNGTLGVAASALNGITLPATLAGVKTGTAIAVQNSAGTSIGSATATVAAGAVSNVKLPATVAGVATGAALTLAGKVYTFTVAAGVISAITVADA